MMRTVLGSFVSMLLTTLAFGQNADFQHNHVSFGVGPAIPVGNDTSYLSTAPFISIAYGYRCNRFFQADIGFELAFGAASNQNAEQTDFGTVQGGNHEYMIPVGGRMIIPTPFKRIEVSAGGGAVHLHYSETIPSNAGYGYYSPSCYSCTSRGGWGGYGLGNVSYFFDENRNFHVGTTVEFIAGRTAGQPVGNVLGVSTTDHWTNVSVEFALSF